jgi:putative ABC transport system permease protein
LDWFDFIIAAPLAWLGADKWLNNFAYKTTISWWLFLAGGSLMLIMSLLILCVRTIKAATPKPGKKFENGIR